MKLRFILSKITIIFLISIIGSYILLLTKDTYLFYETDFHPFYAAAKIFRNDYTKLYDYPTILEYEKRYFLAPYNKSKYFELNPFINTPFLILLYIPFSFMPPVPAYYATVIFMICILVADISLLFKLFKPAKNSLFLILAGLSFTPNFITIYQTQNSLLTLIIIITSYISLRKSRYYLGGLFASLLLYKFQIAIIVFVFLALLRKKQIVYGFISGGIVLFFVSTVMLRGNIGAFIDATEWYAFTYEQLPRNNYLMVSWQGLITQIFSFANALQYVTLIRIISLGLSLATVLTALVKIYRIRVPHNHLAYIFSLMCVTVILSAMHVQSHDAVILLFPFFAYFSSSRKFAIVSVVGWIIYFFEFFSPLYPKPLYLLPTLFLFWIFVCLLRFNSATGEKTRQLNIK